jgi:hypothetical protein
MWEISPRVKQRGSLMIHRSGNPFMQSQQRRRPMRRAVLEGIAATLLETVFLNGDTPHTIG